MRTSGVGRGLVEGCHGLVEMGVGVVEKVAFGGGSGVVFKIALFIDLKKAPVALRQG